MGGMEIIPFLKIQNCRCCNSDNLNQIFHFGNVPLAGDFRKIEDKNIRKLPLTLIKCNHCGLMQVEESVSPNLLFLIIHIQVHQVKV